MRRLRALVQTTIAVLAFSAAASSTAVAAVETSGWSGTLQGTMAFNSYPDPEPGYDPVMCHVDLELEVGNDGSVTVTDVEAYLPYPDYTHQCRWPSGTNEWFDDCDDAGWSGQILGPGDSWETPESEILVEYQGTGDFEAVIDACVHFAPGTHFPFKFAIDADDGNAIWSLESQLIVSYFALSEAVPGEDKAFNDASNHMSPLDIQSVN